MIPIGWYSATARATSICRLKSSISSFIFPSMVPPETDLLLYPYSYLHLNVHEAMPLLHGTSR